MCLCALYKQTPESFRFCLSADPGALHSKLCTCKTKREKLIFYLRASCICNRFNMTTSCISSRCTYTPLIDAQPTCIFPIYIPNACGADTYLQTSVMLCRYVISLSTPSCTSSRHGLTLPETPMNDLNNPILLLRSHLVIAR